MCYFSLYFPHLKNLKIHVYSQHKFLFSLRYFASAILQILLNVLFLLVNHSLFGKIRMEDLIRIEETRQVTCRILCLQGNNISYKKKIKKLEEFYWPRVRNTVVLKFIGNEIPPMFLPKTLLSASKAHKLLFDTNKICVVLLFENFDWKIGLNLDLGSENIIKKLLGANYRKREFFFTLWEFQIFDKFVQVQF